MKRNLIYVLAVILFTVVSCSEKKVEYVDPFIGTGGHGHVFPGATLPFGMVQMTPVNGTAGWDWCSGYNYSDTILTGFAHTALSGTGIGDLLDLMFLPTMEEPLVYEKDTLRSFLRLNRTTFSHENEEASPGYYKVLLNNGVLVELTATDRTGIQKYTAQDDGIMSIMVDLGFALNWDRPVDCSIAFDGKEYSGWRHSSGWASKQFLFFSGQFSKAPSEVRLVKNGVMVSDSEVTGAYTGLIARFDVKRGESIIVKTGISAVDRDGAALNLATEAEQKSFSEARKKASARWEDNLSVIDAEFHSGEHRKIFYTALYHTSIAPNLFTDTDNRYRGTDGEVHVADGFTNYTLFSLWDTYRAAHPLFTILRPALVPDFINTMLSIYRQQGKLPVWSLVGNETDCMVGYHAVPVIADAVIKEFSGFSYETALEAAVHSGLNDFRGVKHYINYGYIPSELENESVAKSLEYAIDDASIALMARKMGRNDLADQFAARAVNYRNLFDAESGFMRGRNSRGEWREPFDPLYSNHRQDDYTEGNAWQYTWLVPHDVDGLISLFGSNEAFIEKLDSLFLVEDSIKGEFASPDISGLIGQYAHGNEPGHHTAYLFRLAGEPNKSERIIRRILTEMYTSEKDGICGNEDCGQMSAWYIFSSLGFYPVNPSNGEFILGSPLVKKASIDVGNGKKFIVTSSGDGSGDGTVSEILLNGQPLKKNSITYKEIMMGGELSFIMN